MTTENKNYLVRVETTDYRTKINLLKIAATSPVAALVRAIQIERKRITGFTSPGTTFWRYFVVCPLDNSERILTRKMPVRNQG